MIRVGLAVAIALLASVGAETKSVSGTVADARGNFLPGAVVQIENTVTLEIQSFIVHENGEYHFQNLNPDVDYSLHAAYRRHLSKFVPVSKFDGKTHIRVNLVVPVE